MEKIVLIDGHSILNRAFYGLPDLTNREGMHTNALLGFLNIMSKILEEETPDYLVVAFDVHAPTFRHKMFEEYKGTRKPMPPELREQVPVLKELLGAMGICIMEQAGLEADDILGTVAKVSEKNGMEVSLVSGDRDLLQIATEKIRIRIPKTKMGKTEVEDYYAGDVLEKYRVTPTQFIDLKALMGDTADNIPGVPKVGEKTATELIVTYQSVDNLYEHIDEVSKKSIRESLIENKDLAYLSKDLATIKTDCDLPLDYEKARVKDFYTEEAYPIFKKLEFKHYLAQFDGKNTSGQTFRPTYLVVSGLADCEARFGELAALRDGAAAGEPVLAGVMLLADEAHELLCCAVSTEQGDVLLFEPDGFATGDYILGKINELAAKDGLTFGLYDSKNQYRFLKARAIQGKCFDIMIGAYLLSPLTSRYPIEAIADMYLGISLKDAGQVFGRQKVRDAWEKKREEIEQYISSCACLIRMAVPVMQKELQDAGMWKLMTEVEMPLTEVLYEMEKEGVRVNPAALKEYGENLKDKIEELEKQIYEEAGEQFNINSPKQLGEILFDKLKLPGAKKTKTGFSTAAEVLEKLAEDYPLVQHILEYRGYSKLKSTYADGLAAFIAPDERIHSTFNQTITATGRISSTDPNLQNIPMRTELGRQIRKVFIPREGYIFTDADYSQIELRVLAHMAGDEQLIEAYRMDEDIHRITASKVFHVPFDQVTDLQRRNAKAVNFGIVYGISSFGLSQDLDISRKEAADYIEEYFKTYPGIKKFLDETVKQAKKDGYVTTMFGRRRPIPELSSSNFMQRSFGERVAMNSPIQGTAADIIKLAMVHVYQRLRDDGLKSRLILQVHDELLIETAEDEKELIEKILIEEMHEAARLRVSLEIDMHTGRDWYEAK